MKNFDEFRKAMETDAQLKAAIGNALDDFAKQNGFVSSQSLMKAMRNDISVQKKVYSIYSETAAGFDYCVAPEDFALDSAKNRPLDDDELKAAIGGFTGSACFVDNLCLWLVNSCTVDSDCSGAMRCYGNITHCGDWTDEEKEYWGWPKDEIW